MRLEQFGLIAIESDERSYIKLMGVVSEAEATIIESSSELLCSYNGVTLKVSAPSKVTDTGYGTMKVTGEITIITVG